MCSVSIALNIKEFFFFSKVFVLKICFGEKNMQICFLLFAILSSSLEFFCLNSNKVYLNDSSFPYSFGLL